MAEVKKYGFWKTIPLSFFSQDVYRDVATRKTSGMSYLVVLAFIAAIAMAGLAAVFTLENIDLEKVSPIIMQLPETMEIKDGELILPENKPYLIEAEGKTFAVLDTSGEYTFDNLGEDLIIVATKEYVALYDTGEKDVEMVRYSEKIEDGFSTSRQEIYEFSDNFIKNWGDYVPVGVFIITAIFATLFHFVYVLVQVLFFSIVGVILNASLKLKLDYSDVFRMTIVSIIPVALMDVLVSYVLQIQYSAWIFVAIAIGWIVFGMTSLKKPKVKNIEQN